MKINLDFGLGSFRLFRYLIEILYKKKPQKNSSSNSYKSVYAEQPRHSHGCTAACHVAERQAVVRSLRPGIIFFFNLWSIY